MIWDFFNGIIAVLKYALDGGFIHFVGCLMILATFTRWSLVRVPRYINYTTKPKKEES